MEDIIPIVKMNTPLKTDTTKKDKKVVITTKTEKKDTKAKTGDKKSEKTDKKSEKTDKKSEKTNKKSERKKADILKTVNPDTSGSGGIRKVRRHKPGVVAKREMRSLQVGKRALDQLIPKLSMEKLIREILADYGLNNDMRLASGALKSLHQASEDAVVDLMDESGDYAVHAKRVTIMPRDLERAKYNVLPKLFHKS